MGSPQPQKRGIRPVGWLLLVAWAVGCAGLVLVWCTREPPTVELKSLRYHASLANEHVRVRGTVAGPITPNAATLSVDYRKTPLSSFVLVGRDDSVTVLFDPQKLPAPRIGAVVAVSGRVRDEKGGPRWMLVAERIE